MTMSNIFSSSSLNAILELHFSEAEDFHNSYYTTGYRNVPINSLRPKMGKVSAILLLFTTGQAPCEEEAKETGMQ